MYILYVDESGVEEVGAGTTHFVLLGLMLPVTDWKQLDRALDAVKSRFDLQHAEIHTAYMPRRYQEQESIAGFDALERASRLRAAQEAQRRRAGILGVQGNTQRIKAYRRQCKDVAPYLHLTRDERLQCLRELAGIIGAWQSIRLFADAISKPDFVPGLRTPYEMAFEQVLTRYQFYLERVGAPGIVVHDNNNKVAPRIHALSQKFHETGTFYRLIPNIVETPLFVDSAFTGMVQMADLCSYALRRLIENGETALWDIVEPRVDTSNGRKVGVRHYTAKRACRCRICVAHGR